MSKLYSTRKAAARLGISVAALKYHIYAGNISPMKVGHSLVFTSNQLSTFSANRRPPGRPRQENKPHE